MRTVRRMGFRLATRTGVRLARRRVVRARSLRWAVRVPLVTMALVAVMALAPGGSRLHR